jgi:hypothetical protein
MTSWPIGGEEVLSLIRDGFRAFVGQTALEELSRQWITQQGWAGQLPFEPEEVGSHWSLRITVDVVAANWWQRSI